MKELILLIFSFIFFTSALSAQDNNAKSGFLPTFLSDMAGEWEVRLVGGYLSGIEISGSWEEGLGGRYMIGKFIGPDTYEHLAVTGFNAQERNYFISVFSNDGGVQFHLDGVYNDSTRTISYKFYNSNVENFITNMIFTDRDNITWEFISEDEQSDIKFTRK